MNRKALTDKVIQTLAALRSRVALSNSLNLTDLSVLCEDFYRDLLNRLYDWQLVNINIGSSNAVAIDLGDINAGVAMQVTGTGALAKLRSTVDAFARNKLHIQYPRLVMLVITGKLNYREPKLASCDGVYTLDLTRDVWDVDHLTREITHKSPEKLAEIAAFLEKELPTFAKEQVPTEIETFFALVYELSAAVDVSEISDSFAEAPDPEGKIERRFADHAAFLQSTYQSLFVDYGGTLDKAMRSVDLGQPRIRRLGNHLRYESDRVLASQGGNARAALDALVDEYTARLQRRGSPFDRGAVLFFLVDQLIRCNVFPNLEDLHVTRPVSQG